MIKRWIRKLFCKNELKKGRMLVLWKDIDDEVCGWTVKADKQDSALAVVGALMGEKKVEKLEQITGIKNKKTTAEILKEFIEEEHRDDTPPPSD